MKLLSPVFVLSKTPRIMKILVFSNNTLCVKFWSQNWRLTLVQAIRNDFLNHLIMYSKVKSAEINFFA
jgi:hypothetical protein